MIVLKPIHLLLRMMMVLVATSCAAAEKPLKDLSGTVSEEVNVLRPAGATVTLERLQAFSILIPEQATDQERYSADMLAEYFGKIFDTPFPVLQEPQELRGKIISVGNTAAAETAKIDADPREQAYKLAVEDGNLYILGGTRGPIYGVIALLEEDLGCRWYSARNDIAPIIPTRSTNKLTLVPRSYAPPFDIRDVFYWDAFSHPPHWAIFNRIQSMHRYNEMTLESGGGLSSSKYPVHTYDTLVPARVYFADHPEYFPLRNGKRHPSTQSDGQLCYTSTGVVEVIVQTLDAEIERNPGTRIYSVSSNDNLHDTCECASCQEIIKTDHVNGAQLHLANEVAAKLAIKYPEIKISTRSGQRVPVPKIIKPGPNTVILYAPIRERFNHTSMLLPIGDIEEIRKQLAEWNQIASHIYIWDYTDIIGKTPVPFPNFDAQERGWDFLIENGVTGVFMQGSFVMHGSLGELKSWLYAKKLWNPTWPMEGLIDEFIHAYYGPAAEEMAQYVALQRQAWSNFYRNRKPGEGLRFSPAEIKKMYDLLDAAMVTYSGQADYIAILEREYLTLLCLSLSDHPTQETAADYADKLKQAEALIHKFEIVNFGEGTTAAGNLRTWNIRLERATGGNPLPQHSPNSVTVKEAICRAGAAYLPDADATLGQASRQPGGNVAWGVQWPFDDFLGLLQPGTVYIVRMRVKSEFNNTVPQNSGELFRFGAFTYGGMGPGGQGPVLSGQFPAGDQGEYRWVELGKLQINTPNAAGYLYCFPGRDLPTGTAVWYDYMEFVPEDEFKDTKRTEALSLIKL